LKVYSKWDKTGDIKIAIIIEDDFGGKVEIPEHLSTALCYWISASSSHMSPDAPTHNPI